LENGIVNLISRLPVDDFRHVVVALTECAPQFCGRIRRTDVEFVSLHKPPGQGWKLFMRMFKLLRRYRPAIVHTRNLAALEMQLPAWAAGVPVRIHGEHGRDALDPDGTNRRYQWVRRAFRPFVTHYVAVSSDLQQYLVETIGISADSVSRICNGVDEKRFAGDDRRHGAAGASADQPLVVGTVGRLDKVKGQSVLVGAIARLLERQPGRRAGLRVRVVGDGPMRAELERDVANRKLGDVIELCGERQDVAELMRKFDVFVLPSIAEGISNTVLEAMACGLPVVATAVGGNVELVSSGRTGLLVPASNTAAMADAIAAYLDSRELRRTHGMNARAEIESRFTLSAMIEQYGELYRRALSATKLHRPATN
jgi:sugar transferase (PEP-CTERM/EpsH1 system associated)